MTAVYPGAIASLATRLEALEDETGRLRLAINELVHALGDVQRRLGELERSIEENDD